MRQVKGLLLLSMLLMALEAISNLAAIGLQQAMIDHVILGDESERFWTILYQIGAAYLIYSLLFTFAPHVMHHIAAKTRISVGVELMRSMHRLPIGQIQKERTADFVYRMTHDMQTAALMAGSDAPRVVQQLSTVFVIVVVMGLSSPYILTVMLVFTVLYIILARKIGPVRKRASSEVNQSRSAVLVHLEEGVSSTREVIAFHRQEWENELYHQKFKTYFEKVMKEGGIINKQLLMSEPLKWGAMLFMLSYGGYLVLESQLSVGMFVIALQFTTRMMDSLNGLFQFVMDFSGRLSSVERIRKISEGEKIDAGTSGIDGAIREIKFHQVSFQYNELTVLRKVNLQLTTGQKIAFVGASGGGKSTIASLIARYFNPVSGMITVNGLPLSDLKREAWMARLTLVAQEPYLFPDTIRMNLLMGREDIPEERMFEMCKAMCIHDFFAQLPQGYDTPVGERGVTLSGGQRQRLALARAVLRDSELLILDEATSSLDLETERQVQEALDQLRRGKTTIIIAHRLSTVRNADLIIVMDQGQVAEQGTHEELMAGGRVYRSLVHKEEDQLEDVG